MPQSDCAAEQSQDPTLLLHGAGGWLRWQELGQRHSVDGGAGLELCCGTYSII